MSDPRRHTRRIQQRLQTASEESSPIYVRGESLLAQWAQSFVFAGSSALLLLIANLFPDYWYFSFFALTPFLYRIFKNVPGESLRLGFLLGLSFFGALSWHSIMATPLVFVPKLLGGIALFSLFGWAAGWSRGRWGFNPFVVAVLWVGLETGLRKLGFGGGVFGESGFSHPLLNGFAGLLGFLAVSALIVALNSFLVLAVLGTLEIVRVGGKTVGGDQTTWGVICACGSVTDKVYLVPESRAPPFFVRLGR